MSASMCQCQKPPSHMFMFTMYLQCCECGNCAGDCPDYRWSYSGRSPSVRGLRALAATATAAMAAAVTAANVSSEHHRLSLASFALNTAAAAAADSRNGSLAAWQAMVAAAASELSGSSGSSGFESLLPHVCRWARFQLLPAVMYSTVLAA